MTLTEAPERARVAATERTRNVTVKVYEPPSSLYSTNDEITFLRGLLTGSAKSSKGVCCTNGWAGHGANPEAFVKYAGLILAGMRAYGNTVDVVRVRAEILKLMPSLRPTVREPAAANCDRTTDEDYGPKARERRRQERVA